MKYNHAYSFAFEVVSNDPDGEDVTGERLRDQLLARLNRLTDAEVSEACDCPWDSHEVSDE